MEKQTKNENKFKKWLKNDWEETKVLFKSIPGWILSLFVVAIVSMNLLASKSIDLGAWGDWLALDCGIVVSWLAFLTMDIIVKTFGPRAATKVTIFAVLVNLLFTFIFWIISIIPGFWGESFIEFGSEIANTAINNTFHIAWFVVFGSTVAMIIAALVNNFLNWGIALKFRKSPDSYKAFATASFVSTFTAQIVDNLIFALIVSLNFFGWTFTQCLTCAITGAVVELLCEVIFSPLGYSVARKWEKEGISKKYKDLVFQNKAKNFFDATSQSN